MIVIQNAALVTPTELPPDSRVVLENGRIQTPTSAQSMPSNAQIIDATGLTLLPGFIDLQLNGAFGHDFTQNPETIWQVAAQLPQFGVTSFLPTIITSPLATVKKVQTVLGRRPSTFQGAEPLGLHLEGPFLNPQKKGAHDAEFMQLPSLELVADWSPENQVRLVTLAPERPLALDVITALAQRGVVVSAGHSMATYEQALAGFEAGIRYGTHLFNAMPPLHHREPGLAAALLADERLTIGLIPDGIHVHPALIKTVWQAVGPRVNVVTDAISALGMPAGDYQLGGFEISVDETICRLADGTLAGSILSLDTAVGNLISYTGCTLAEAVSTVTIIPAALLGIAHKKGKIALGYAADLVLVTADLEVAMTFVNGEVVYRKNSA